MGKTGNRKSRWLWYICIIYLRVVDYIYICHGRSTLEVWPSQFVSGLILLVVPANKQDQFAVLKTDQSDSTPKEDFAQHPTCTEIYRLQDGYFTPVRPHHLDYSQIVRFPACFYIFFKIALPYASHKKVLFQWNWWRCYQLELHFTHLWITCTLW
jgi:hypothetical protein